MSGTGCLQLLTLGRAWGKSEVHKHGKNGVHQGGLHYSFPFPFYQLLTNMCMSMCTCTCITHAPPTHTQGGEGEREL